MISPTRMRAEIGDQPAALRRTVDALLPTVPELKALTGSRGSVGAVRQVLFIARGSSDNAAVYGRYLVETEAGVLVTLAAPSVATTYRRRLDLSGVLAVAISQSGCTEEIVETLDWAGRSGARTVAITNSAGSPLTEIAELALITQAGREEAVPATKTYTTQLAALAVVAIALGAELDPAVLRAVPDEIERLIAVTEASEILPLMVEELSWMPGVVVSGRGLAYGTALELALKLKEACYLPSMGLSYADLLHGPIATVDADTPVILVAADSGPVLSGVIALARRVTGSGARAYGIGGGPALAAECSLALAGCSASDARLPEWAAPLSLVVPGQLLVEALARRLGIDPDLPRGLGKVTQTD